MVIEVRAGAGSVQLVSWGEARLVEDSQEDWGQGTLVGVEARADGTLVLVDSGSPVFQRSSVAYLSNGTQVASGQPRFETVNGRTGVLVEEGTTNLLKHSEALDNTSSWARTELAAVTPVAGASPAGTTAYVLVPTTAGIAHSLVQGVTVSGGSGVYITLSCYFKAKEYNHARLTVRINDGSTNRWPLAIFRLTDGVVTRLDGRGVYTVSAQAVHVGGGWWRCSLTVQVPAGHTVMDAQINVSDNTGAEYFAGNGASGVYAWGAQLETKAYMTSYMPTTSSSATRAAEMLTVPTAGVLFPQEGTIGVWSYVPSVVIDGSTIFWHTTDAGAAYPRPNTIRLQRGSDGKYRVVLTDATMQQTSLVTPNVVSEGWHFFAVRWSAQEAALFLDGVKVASATNPRIPQAVATEFILGSGLNGVGKPFANINSFLGPVRISRRARTDQEIADAYAAGTLELDEDTTILLPLSGSLAYGRGGYRIAPAVDLSRVGLVYASRLEWEADDAGVEVQTSLDGGQTWQQAQNGGPVPSIVPGQDVTGKTLLVKQCLLAQDMAAAPVLRRLGARVISEPRLAKHQGRVELLGGG